jgi:Na+-driven multidrug efflux pump
MTVGIVTSVLVLPAAYICIRILHIGLWGVPISWIFAWTARAVLTGFKLRDGSWTRRTLFAR